MNHSLLPSVATATLPAKYEAAKLAISECNRIDECKDWDDKAQAMASYARQADDKEMEKTAFRIRARAARRCGELYKEIEKATGAHLKRGVVSPLSRKGVAEAVGHSPDQMKQKIRLANIPAEKFEAQIESESPPTIASLAEQGMAKGIPRYEQLGMTEKAWRAGMYFGGSLRDFAKETEEFDPQDVVDGSTPEERESIRRNIQTIDKYLDQLIAKL